MKSRIRERRNELNMTLEELSEKSNTTVRRLSDIELDKCGARVSTMVDIAAALETTVSYLLGEIDTPQTKTETEVMETNILTQSPQKG